MKKHRMVNAEGKCCGCTACVNICPVNAITMKSDKEGFLRAEVNYGICIQCGRCEKVCLYFKDILVEKHLVDKQKYAAFQISNEEKLFNSSSGGAFIAISDYILSMRGVVYGAVYDKNNQVIHARVETKDDRDYMCKSKYVQSDLKNCFLQIKRDLGEGRLVLFTGTPCQCEGLKQYINKVPDNLLLVDVLCHGVPSPLIWLEYLKKIEETLNEKVEYINFRDKTKGWKTYLLAKTKNKEYHGNPTRDEFLVLYFKDLISRPECHECLFASYERVSDITIGDFWGAENVFPEYDDKKGISLLLGNTEKGNRVIGELNSAGMLKYTERENVYQPILKQPFGEPRNREAFWKDYHERGYYFATKRYAHLSFFAIALRSFLLPITKKIGIYNILQRIYYLIKQ